MAQEYIYVPSGVAPTQSPNANKKSPTYYSYEPGSAGRLTSALPTYQAYMPVTVQAPNVPVYCLPAFSVLFLHRK